MDAAVDGPTRIQVTGSQNGRWDLAAALPPELLVDGQAPSCLTLEISESRATGPSPVDAETLPGPERMRTVRVEHRVTNGPTATYTPIPGQHEEDDLDPWPYMQQANVIVSVKACPPGLLEH